MARGRLEQATAVVVGPVNTLLRACVADLAERGADVLVLTDSTTEAGTATVEGARAVELVAEDEADAMRRIAGALGEGWPPVRALVNAHMAIEAITIRDSTLADWERVLRSNVLGPIAACQAFLPALEAAGGGAIVLMGSIDGFLGNPAFPSYSVSKGALIPLTHVMADELGAHGVRVNCVARAIIVDPATPPAPPYLLAEIPLGRAGEPREVASVVGFLATEESSYVNGTVVVVDGGRTGITPGTRPMAPWRIP